MTVEITNTMRFIIYIFFLFIVGQFFTCKPKYGAHKMIHTEKSNHTSDEVNISYLTDQIEDYPQEEDNYLKLANIYQAQDNYSKAIAILQEAEKENPKNTSILINLSTFYLQEKNIENLLLTLNALKEIAPDNMHYLKLVAGYYILIEDHSEALFFTNRALIANPFDHESFYNRGWAQLINKDSLDALISFEEAYQLKNSYQNFAKLFDVSLAMGLHDNARKYLEETTNKSGMVRLDFEWGAYYNKIEERDSSRMFLMKCVQEKPEETRVYFELAKNYFGVRQYDSSLYYIHHYIDTNPKGTGAYVLKAQALEKKYLFSEARQIYIHALELDSTSTLAAKGLDNLERKVAYLRLKKRKQEVERQVETLKPLDTKEIN